VRLAKSITKGTLYGWEYLCWILFRQPRVKGCLEPQRLQRHTLRFPARCHDHSATATPNGMNNFSCGYQDQGQTRNTRVENWHIINWAIVWISLAFTQPSPCINVLNDKSEPRVIPNKHFFKSMLIINLEVYTKLLNLYCCDWEVIGTWLRTKI